MFGEGWYFLLPLPLSVPAYATKCFAKRHLSALFATANMLPHLTLSVSIFLSFLNGRAISFGHLAISLAALWLALCYLACKLR